MAANNFRLETSAGTLMVDLEVTGFEWSVVRNGEDITFTLGEGENEQSEIHKTTDVRKFVLDNFNWNGIVHFMHLLSDKNDAFTYTRPTGLNGIPADDDLLIIPDEATEAIIYEQAKFAIETTYKDAPESNIDKIVKYVDGKAKKGFAADVLETTYEDLIKESDNSEMEYEGTSFTMPVLDTVNEADLYDFLKNLTLSRYGLWCDDNNLTNVVSIRRDIESNKSKYNDTLFIAWKEGGAKRAIQYIGSTEPGDLGASEDGQLLPQTLTFILGIHTGGSSATPGARTRNAYRKAKGGSSKYFKSGDTSMNIHYGHPNMAGLPKSYGFHNNSDGKGYDAVEQEAFSTVVGVYYILTQWGAGRNSKTSAYRNLENYTKEYTLSAVKGTTEATRKIEILQGGTKVIKKLMYTGYKSYVDTAYAATGNKAKDKKTKKKIIELLMAHHNLQSDGTLESSYLNDEISTLLVELKKQDVWKSMIEIQLEHQLDVSKVDGKPGKGTLLKINRTVAEKEKKKKEFEALKKSADEDWDTLSDLFATWDANAKLKNKKLGGISFKKHFQEKIKLNKEDYKTDSKIKVDDSGGKGINKEVGPWSDGCQIILGGQNFYQFLFNVVQFVESSKQERWYYTIVDMDNITGVSKGTP